MKAAVITVPKGGTHVANLYSQEVVTMSKTAKLNSTGVSMSSKANLYSEKR